MEITRRSASADEAAALEINPGDVLVYRMRPRLQNCEPTMVERTRFREDVCELLFGIDIDAGSVTEAMADHGVGYGEVMQEIDAVAADEVDALHLGIDNGASLLRHRRSSHVRSVGWSKMATTSTAPSWSRSPPATPCPGSTGVHPASH